MGKAILLFKTLVLGYIVYTVIDTALGQFAYLLTLVLAVLSLGVLIPAVKKPALKILFVSLSLALVIVSYSIHPSIIIVLPVLLTELFFLINLDIRYGIPLILILLPLSFVYDITGLYFLVSGFSVVLYSLIPLDSRLESLQRQNDELKISNDRLNQKLRFDKELKRQLTYNAQLEERNKIAQEIHDKVGHSISGSLMQLEAVKLIAKTDPDKTASMLENIIGTLRNGLESIRQTLRNIKPPSEQMGLNRIQLMIDDFNNSHNIKASFTHKGDISRVSPIIWSIFLDNISEGLTNVLRHSNADKVTINLNIMNKMISLQMADNGFCREKIKKGLGLSGMEERLIAVGGNLLIDTSKGFSLSMLVPIKGDNDGYKTSAG